MFTKYLSFLFIVMFSSSWANAQTFNGAGGDIPDDGTAPTCFPITVTGIGALSTTYGLASVCLDITHTWDSDLEITLVCPDGTSIPLAIQQGGSADNFTGTCFTGDATSSITTASAPFTGNFLAEFPLGLANNGQNASGQWTLCIQDVFAGFTGTLNSWSLTFNNVPAPPPPIQPPCSGNLPAGNNCTLATPVCNFSGYCGNTSAAYTVDSWPELETAFCGSIDNNSFITFVASATTASFNVWVSNSQDGLGIQMMFYDGGCGSGAVTEYGCYGDIDPNPFPTVVEATGLTIGNTYYLMFDGYAGDVCDYNIAPLSGVNILDITTSFTNATICIGQSIDLTASGGNGTYTWTGPNLNATTGTTVTATPTTTSVYSVTSATTSGDCPLSREITVNVTITPDPPTVSTPISLCQGAAAAPLTATGTDLLWYAAATGGTGSTTAPTPNTTAIGSTTYYVTQTLPCGESPRTPIVVNVSSGTPAPLVTSPTVLCQNSAASPLTATGLGLLWYTTPTGGVGNANAPVPSTATPGTTTYYVSQSGSCGESPRAALAVNVTTAPSAPIVNSPLTLCLNSASVPLTATGTGLLWYTTATGGTGSAAAPFPSTTASGNTNYYLSQTVNGCEGPRATLTVTVLSYTDPPTFTNPVVYCTGAAAVPLTANGPGLLWYTTAIGGTGSSTTPTPSTAVAGTTVYYVTQSTNCGESTRGAITVIVNNTPAAPIVTPTYTYCLGAVVNPLTANGSGLLWYTTATGGVGSNTSITPSTASIGSTTYYVTQTILSCESPRASITVNISGISPAPSVTDDTLVYCQLQSAQPLSANGNSLQWYTVSTGGTPLASTPTPSTLHAGITTYYVTQTLNCGESPSTPIVVVVDTTPVAPAVITPIEYCQGTNTTALAANGSNILWYAAASGGIGSTTAPVPTSINTGNTDYYVSSTIGACEGPRAILTVVVNPTPGIAQTNTPITYCQGNATTPLIATGSNILWYTSATGTAGSSSAPTPLTNIPGTTTYYTSQTLGVCEGPRTAVDVVVLATPHLGADKSDTICFADTYDLNTLFNTNGLSTQWTLNGTPVTNANAVAASGTYQLEVTNNNGCSDTALFFFTKLPPVIAFAGNDTIAMSNTPHQLHAMGGVNYSWSPVFPLSDATIQNPTATLNADQQFIVTVYNEIGCAGFDTVFIRVYDGGPVYRVPNAFTPNGDGMNDIFRPVPVGIVNTDWFRVYNRNGQLIFNNNKWLYGWDGTFNGRKQPAGTYVWMVKGYDKDGTPIIQKGTVILIR